MARIEVATHIEAPPERVWSALVDWERQADWMSDVSSVEVSSEQRTGLGVRLRARTHILGVSVNDELVVTEWSPNEALGVTHLGWVIRGVAAFELTPTTHGTHVAWWEEAQAPLEPVGEAVAGALVVPWVRRVFRRNLAALKRLCETPAA